MFLAGTLAMRTGAAPSTILSNCVSTAASPITAETTPMSATPRNSSLSPILPATSRNLPRLHAPFVNKPALYLEALARYWQTSLAATREALAQDRPLGESLMLAFEAALSIYFSGKGSARGCFVIGTAVTEAV